MPSTVLEISGDKAIEAIRDKIKLQSPMITANPALPVGVIRADIFFHPNKTFKLFVTQKAAYCVISSGSIPVTAASTEIQSMIKARGGMCRVLNGNEATQMEGIANGINPR